MRSAERRKKAVKGYLVGQIRDLKRCSDLLALFRMQQIIRADAEIEHVAWLDAIGVMIVRLVNRNR